MLDDADDRGGGRVTNIGMHELARVKEKPALHCRHDSTPNLGTPPQRDRGLAAGFARGDLRSPGIRRIDVGWLDVSLP